MAGLIDSSMTTSKVPDLGTVQTAGTTSYDPEKRSIDQAKETVSGQLDSILAKDSPLMQRAAAGATATANARGLVNSSMAAQAGQAAMIDAATPIATSDANIYGLASRENQLAGNTALSFGAGAKNAANLASTADSNRATLGLQGDAATAARDAALAVITTKRDTDLAAITTERDRVAAGTATTRDADLARLNAERERVLSEYTTARDRALAVDTTARDTAQVTANTASATALAGVNATTAEKLAMTNAFAAKDLAAVVATRDDKLIGAAKETANALEEATTRRDTASVTALRNAAELIASASVTRDETLRKNASETALALVNATKDRDKFAIDSLSAAAALIAEASVTKDEKLRTTNIAAAQELVTAAKNTATQKQLDDLALQGMKGEASIALAETEGTYRKLIQTEASVGAYFSDAMKAMNTILTDTKISAEQKTSAIAGLNTMLASGLAVHSLISNLNMKDALSFVDPTT